MRALAAMVRKDLTLLVRDKAALFFTFLFPVMMAVFFGSVFAGDSGSTSKITLVAVDEDGTSHSATFLDALRADKDLELASQLVSRHEAIELVRHGNRTAYVLIPSGFGATRGQMFWGTPATVQVGVDPSRNAEAAMLQGILTRYLFDDFGKLFTDRVASRQMVRASRKSLAESGDSLAQRGAYDRFLNEFDRFLDVASDQDSTDEQAWEPAAVQVTRVTSDQTTPPNYFAVSFPQGIVWGLMMCAITFAMGLVTERTQGTLMRLRVAPISRAQILLGKAGACFVTVLVVQTLLLTLGVWVFGVSLGPLPMVAMAMLAGAIAFVGIMMLLSVLGRTEKAASGYATASMLIMMMLGGGMLPLIAMPSWMQSVSHVSPVKWAVLATEGAIWRGFGPEQMALPCGILVGVGIACFVAGTKLFRDG